MHLKLQNAQPRGIALVCQGGKEPKKTNTVESDLGLIPKTYLGGGLGVYSSLCLFCCVTEWGGRETKLLCQFENKSCGISLNANVCVYVHAWVCACVKCRPPPCASLSLSEGWWFNGRSAQSEQAFWDVQSLLQCSFLFSVPSW